MNLVRVLGDDACHPHGAHTYEGGSFMRRTIVSKTGIVSGFVLATSLLFAPKSLAQNDSESCQQNDGAYEALTLSDVKLNFSERDNGYVILITSPNPTRKEVIRRLVFELLKEKSLLTHETTNGYGLEAQ